MIRKTSHLWIITFALLFLWLTLLFRMDEPFYGHHENPPVWMSASVRNMNQFGPGAVNFLPLRNPGPRDIRDEDNWYYIHHPPTIVWIEAIATQLFGVNEGIPTPKESSIRMVAYIATMLTLPLFYVMLRRLSNADTALIGFFLYLLTPITLYFGRTPHYDIMLMPVVYLFMAIFINWMQRYTLQRSVMLTATAIFLMWIDWPGAFYLTGCGIFALIFGQRKQRIGILFIGMITFAATALIPLMYTLVYPDTISDLQEILQLRTSTRSTGFESETLTLMKFLETYLEHMLTVTSVAVFIFGSIGIGRLLIQKKNHNSFFILMLVITAFVFMATVPNSFNFHDWYKIHFLHGFSMAGATLIYSGWQQATSIGLKRYIKPLIVALSVSSIGVTIFWTYQLHDISIANTFARSMATELPLYTEEDDLIASNYNRVYIKIEYYAYRNIRWGILPDEAVRFYNETNSVDLYYLLCLTPETVDSYDGELSDLDYVVIADQCRLIHLEK